MKNAKMLLDRRTFLAASVGTALGLGVSPSRSQPVKGGQLVVALSGGASSDNLDPTITAAGPVGNILKQASDHLIHPSPDGRGLEPMLAESWDHSADLKTWTFKLRKGVTFHNGKTLTANDAVFSLNRHYGPKSASGAAGGLATIADVKAGGLNELIVTLHEGNVDFPFLLTDYHVVIQPEGDPGNSGIFTGPYKIEEAAHGTRYLVSKYKDYWRQDVGFVDTIQTLVINDNTARISALLDGRVHLIDRIEPKIVSMIKGAAKVVTTAGRGHYSFAMRCDTAPFDNPHLRMALKLAIDREQILKQVMRGFGAVGNDSPVNKAYPLSVELPPRHYDPDGAAAAYKKSGHSGPITLHVSDVAFAGAVDAAQLFQQSAARCGITIDIKREPGDGYWSDVWNKAPFCGTYWDGRPTQDQVLSLAYRSDAPWNDTAWRRPEFDALLSKARQETDDSLRTELYHRACAMVQDDGGAIIPVFSQYLDGVSDKVQGYVPDLNNELMNGRYGEKCWLAS